MLGDCDCVSFNFSRTGTRFALLLVLWVLALPPLFYGSGRGDSSFFSNATEEANLGAFLWAKLSRFFFSLRGFGRVIRAAWSGRCGL